MGIGRGGCDVVPQLDVAAVAVQCIPRIGSNEQDLIKWVSWA